VQDPKQVKAESQKSTGELLEERQSDATDAETLRDIEENRRSVSSGESDQNRTPSPDGAFDESKETKEFGPM